MAEEKTNVMRLLDQKKVPYIPHYYACPDGAVDGVSVAARIGKDAGAVFKTLVTQGATGKYYVFVVPVLSELDRKAAARAVREKSIEMIHVKDITAVSGYVRGGCSPIGMKKQYPTFIHEAAKEQDKITVSGGRLGLQITLSPDDLCRAAKAEYADIIK